MQAVRVQTGPVPAPTLPQVLMLMYEWAQQQMSRSVEPAVEWTLVQRAY